MRSAADVECAAGVVVTAGRDVQWKGSRGEHDRALAAASGQVEQENDPE